MDSVTIRRVANGWVIQPAGRGPDEFTHVATTPEDLAEHVAKWARAQTVALSRLGEDTKIARQS
jgi:hypothetical protein